MTSIYKLFNTIEDHKRPIIITMPAECNKDISSVISALQSHLTHLSIFYTVVIIGLNKLSMLMSIIWSYPLDVIVVNEETTLNFL